VLGERDSANSVTQRAVDTKRLKQHATGSALVTSIKYYNCTLKLFLLNMLVYEFMIPAANVIKVTPGETIGDALEKVNHECRCTNRQCPV
jgi:hypothetical protein